MLKFIKLLFTLTLLLQFSLALKSQEFVGVSQYMYHKQFYNPAAMSSNDNINAVMLYRSQWLGMDGAPSVYAFNASLPLKKGAFGIGLSRSTIGIHESNSFLFSYAYRLQLGKFKYLSFGLSAGLKFQNRNYLAVNSHDKNDDYFSTNLSSDFVPNLQFGVLLFSKNYYIGLSIPQLVSNDIDVVDNKISNNYTFESRKLRLYLNGGYEYNLTDVWRFNVSSLIKYENNSPLNFDFNLMSTYLDKIGFGLSYRTPEQLMVLLNLRVSKGVKLGYAYHMTFVSNQILNSHEIVLLFNLKKKGRLRIQSPRF
ncbi:MAG: PorP/SprF family type IX secretion system membrane protein [Marinifilaceae bacterium]